MNIVLIRPVEDPDVVEVFAVQHTNGQNARFEEQWDIAVAHQKKHNPETWGIEDVFKAMEKLGWEFMRINDTTTVTY